MIMDLTTLIAIGAGIAVATGIGAGVGIGIATSGLVQAIARQPEARGSIMSSMLLGCAVAETCSVYGLIVALILLLANPFVGLL